MPLMKRSSKKALQHNIKAEIDAHPDKRKQDLAIAFSVQRQAKKKKMAEGGEVNAKNERRPMPDNRYDDAKMVSHNSGNKPPKNDSWVGRPTVAQAQDNDTRGKKLPIKRPRMVPSDAFSTRLYDKEGNLEESASPGPYGAQPESWENEEGANRQGPPVRDMEDEHSTHRKPYAKGGQIEAGDSESHNINMRTDMEPADSGIQEREREDEKHLMDMESPSEDEGQSDADSRNEERPDRQGDEVPDMEAPHNEDQSSAYAEGGEVDDSEKSSDDERYETEKNRLDKERQDISSDPQPYAEGGEVEEEHHNSIAAAIMARRDRLHAEIDSGAHDLDSAARMAEGGILSHDSIYSDDSDQADLSRNHDEDANEEDQLSFNALRKENYNSSNLDVDGNIDSAQIGDSEEEDSENKHDMVSSIRRKMNSKRQFKD